MATSNQWHMIVSIYILPYNRLYLLACSSSFVIANNILARVSACKIDSGILLFAETCNPETKLLHLMYKLVLARSILLFIKFRS